MPKAKKSTTKNAKTVAKKTDGYHFLETDHRVSMWFAAPNLTDSEFHLAKNALTPEGIDAVENYLDQCERSVLHLVYDPLLIENGEQNHILVQLKEKYGDRLELLDVNNEELFLRKKSSYQEVIIYFYTRFLLTLARSPNPDDRASVNMAAIKDMLQLLTELCKKGNIMDLIDNVILNNLLPSWAKLQRGTAYIASFLSAPNPDGSLALLLSNDLFMPTFSSHSRDQINPEASEFLTTVIDGVLSKVLSGPNEQFKTYFKEQFGAYVKEQFPSDSRKLPFHLDQIQKINDKHPTLIDDTAKASLLNLFDHSDHKKADDIWGLIKTTLLGEEEPTYTSVVRLLAQLDHKKYQSTQIAIYKRFGANKARSETNFQTLKKNVYKKFIINTAGPGEWRNALETLHEKTSKETDTNRFVLKHSFNSALLERGDDNGNPLLRDYIHRSSSMSHRAIAVEILLLLCYPKAYRLINTNRQWMPGTEKPSKSPESSTASAAAASTQHQIVPMSYEYHVVDSKKGAVSEGIGTNFDTLDAMATSLKEKLKNKPYIQQRHKALMSSTASSEVAAAAITDAEIGSELTTAGSTITDITDAELGLVLEATFYESLHRKKQDGTDLTEEEALACEEITDNILNIIAMLLQHASKQNLLTFVAFVSTLLDQFKQNMMSPAEEKEIQSQFDEAESQVNKKVIDELRQTFIKSGLKNPSDAFLEAFRIISLQCGGAPGTRAEAAVLAMARTNTQLQISPKGMSATERQIIAKTIEAYAKKGEAPRGVLAAQGLFALPSTGAAAAPIAGPADEGQPSTRQLAAATPAAGPGAKK